MTNSFSKTIAMLIMLSTFIGQAYANASMSCEMDSPSHHQMDMTDMDMDMDMDHQMMNSSSMSTADNQDCCDIECSCPKNACSSMSLLSKNYSDIKLPLYTESIRTVTKFIPNSFVRALYRPPIFA